VQICGKGTGHAEVVAVTFDPAVVTFRDLLDVFFTIHDPTTPNRQGADVGPQYRSIILYTSDEQKRVAEEVGGMMGCCHHGVPALRGCCWHLRRPLLRGCIVGVVGVVCFPSTVWYLLAIPSHSAAVYLVTV
jgi:hypothetical protein